MPEFCLNSSSLWFLKMLPGKLLGCWKVNFKLSTTEIWVMRPWPFSSATVGLTLTSGLVKVARALRMYGAKGTFQARARASRGLYWATSWMGAVIHRGVLELQPHPDMGKTSGDNCGGKRGEKKRRRTYALRGAASLSGFSGGRHLNAALLHEGGGQVHALERIGLVVGELEALDRLGDLEGRELEVHALREHGLGGDAVVELQLLRAHARARVDVVEVGELRRGRPAELEGGRQPRLHHRLLVGVAHVGAQTDGNARLEQVRHRQLAEVRVATEVRADARAAVGRGDQIVAVRPEGRRVGRRAEGARAADADAVHREKHERRPEGVGVVVVALV